MNYLAERKIKNMTFLSQVHQSLTSFEQETKTRIETQIH